MVTESKITTALEEIKTALSSIESGDTYNYTYGKVARGQLDHSALAVDIYPTIEIRQLNVDDKILANRTFERELNIYIVITKDTSSEVADEDKEDIVEKMKQDVLNRLSTALIDQEFSIIHHFEPTKEDIAIIEGAEKIQGGIAITLSFKHLYNAW